MKEIVFSGDRIREGFSKLHREGGDELARVRQPRAAARGQDETCKQRGDFPAPPSATGGQFVASFALTSFPAPPFRLRQEAQKAHAAGPILQSRFNHGGTRIDTDEEVSMPPRTMLWGGRPKAVRTRSAVETAERVGGASRPGDFNRRPGSSERRWAFPHRPRLAAAATAGPPRPCGSVCTRGCSPAERFSSVFICVPSW